MAARPAEPRGVAPRETVGARPLSSVQRIGLAAEILRAHMSARRLLRRVPITAAVAMLRTQGPAASVRAGTIPAETALEEARRLGRAVTRTLTLVPGDTRCLIRSLVLTRLLARRGIPAKLVIGARAAPSFLAHAWVEHAGHPVLPPGEESFARLVEL